MFCMFQRGGETRNPPYDKNVGSHFYTWKKRGGEGYSARKKRKKEDPHPTGLGGGDAATSQRE